MEDISKIEYQYNKFCNVQNLMSFFTADELLFQHKKQQIKEIRHIKQNFKKNGFNIDVLKNCDLKNLSEEDIATLDSLFPRY